MLDCSEDASSLPVSQKTRLVQIPSSFLSHPLPGKWGVGFFKAMYRIFHQTYFLIFNKIIYTVRRKSQCCPTPLPFCCCRGDGSVLLNLGGASGSPWRYSLNQTLHATNIQYEPHYWQYTVLIT
jgi:hypothetical protein